MRKLINTFLFFGTFLATLLGFVNPIAQAAQINVTDSATPADCYNPGGDPCTDFNGNDCTLQDALDVAECNGEADTINVAAGFYDADAAGGFDYNADAAENFALEIIGEDSATTILDGGMDDINLDISIGFATPDDAADVTISNITFQNGNYSGPGGGLSVDTDDADITVTFCHFLQNFSDEWGGGIYAQADGDGNMFFDSNYFELNSATEEGGGTICHRGRWNLYRSQQYLYSERFQ